MKYILISCLLSISLVVYVFAADSDFRKISWGMTASDITDREGKPTARTHNGNFDTLVFTRDVTGLSAKTTYFLLNQAVGKGEYVFNIDYTNPNYYIYDFDKLKKGLIKKYGPTKEKDPMVWLDTTYKGNPDQYGLAVAKGHLQYVSHWETSTTKIELLLKGENLKPRLRLTYTGKDYEKQVEKLVDEESSEGL